jgi:predicted HAD superfamily Cof-like phosphohydrolase
LVEEPALQEGRSPRFYVGLVKHVNGHVTLVDRIDQFNNFLGTNAVMLPSKITTIFPKEDNMQDRTPIHAGGKTPHYQRVEELMRRIEGQPSHLPAPIVPDAKTRALRAKLIFEEAMETINALGVEISFPNYNAGVGILLNEIKGEGKAEVIEHEFNTVLADDEVSLEEIADGCADVSVVTMGTLVACGIPDDDLLQLIDTTNLDKFGPGHTIREDGKLMKPPTWQPPNIAGLLHLQGYEHKDE